jgi:hemoglobin
MPLTLLLRSTLLAALCGLGVVHAQSPSPHAPAAPMADDSLYQAFGARPGLVRLMDRFMVRLLDDPRMQPFFKDVDQNHVKAQLVAQLCELSGGPCRLNGPDMKKAHSGMDITKSDFNALVEVLQLSMDDQNIPFSVQNRMLARLAPMHREIVNTP